MKKMISILALLLCAALVLPAAAQPLTLKDFLGRWSEADQRFIFRDTITWDTTIDEVKKLLGEEKVEEFKEEDVLALTNKEIIMLEQGISGACGFVFLHDDVLALIGCETVPTKNGCDDAYEKLRTALSELYGEADTPDMEQLSALLLRMGSDSDYISEIEPASLRRWYLPDNRTVVYICKVQSKIVAILYINLPAFPGA